MELQEVSLVTPEDQYSQDFFAAVSAQPEGKVFSYNNPISGSTLRSRAQTFGAKLGKKFTIVELDPIPASKDLDGNAIPEQPRFAVGVTTKVRAPRSKSAPAAPAEGSN